MKETFLALVSEVELKMKVELKVRNRIFKIVRAGGGLGENREKRKFRIQ